MNGEISVSEVEEIVHGPYTILAQPMLPKGYVWFDEQNRVVRRECDKKLFAAEKEMDISHRWSIDDIREPCCVAPTKRFILTSLSSVC